MAVAVAVVMRMGMRLAVQVVLQRGAFQMLDFEQAVQMFPGIDQALGAQGAGARNLWVAALASNTAMASALAMMKIGSMCMAEPR